MPKSVLKGVTAAGGGRGKPSGARGGKAQRRRTGAQTRDHPYGQQPTRGRGGRPSRGGGRNGTVTKSGRVNGKPTTAQRGGRGGKRGGRGRGGKKSGGRPAKEKVNESSLDDEMDDYWVKSGKTEIIEKIEKAKEEKKAQAIAARAAALDDEMDGYWKAKEAKAAEAGKETPADTAATATTEPEKAAAAEETA